MRPGPSPPPPRNCAITFVDIIATEHTMTILKRAEAILDWLSVNMLSID